jgi:hypothetical protein
MGCTQSFDVHVEADDIQDGDVVGCFCGGCSDGCMGRIKNAYKLIMHLYYYDVNYCVMFQNLISTMII